MFIDWKLTQEVIKISWPMIVSELSDSIYSITDTYFVSGLGETALAATGLGSYLSWLFFVLVSMFYTGVLVYTAQSKGAGVEEKARKGLAEVILYGTPIMLTISLVAFLFADQLVYIVSGGDQTIMPLATAYFRTRVLGLTIVMIALSLDAALRGLGFTKYSMYSAVFSVIVNIILDPLLIYGYLGFPAYGVVGAALATIISIAAMIPAELFFLRKVHHTPIFTRSITEFIGITKLGLPVAGERSIFALGNTVFIGLISRCGQVALAAHNIGIRIESFIYMPGFAFSLAASTLVGQRIGAGDRVGAKKIGLEIIKIGTLIMGLLGVVAALASYYIVAPFSPTEEVRELAVIYLILAGLSEPGLALTMIGAGGIRGAGETRIPLIVNGVSFYLSRILPSLFLIPVFGVIGAWIAMFIDVYVRGFIFLLIYVKWFDKIARVII